MKNDFKPLGSLLQNIVQKHNLESDYNLFKLERNWGNIVEPQIAKVAKPYKLEGKILTIKVESNIWREEIKEYSQEILNKINNNMQDMEIKVLKII